MDHLERIEERFQKIRTPETIFFRQLVKHKFHDQPVVCESFFRILTEYTYGRIESEAMYLQVSRLFRAHPEIIKVFCICFRQAMSTKDDDVETPRPAKKVKTEYISSNLMTVFDSTSNPSTSHAFKHSQSPYSSACSPLEWEAIVSRSSSSQSEVRNSNLITVFDPTSNPSTSCASQSSCSSGSSPLEGEAVASRSSSPPSEVCEAQNQEIAELFDGTLYVTETNIRLIDEPQAYQHLAEFVNEISANRNDTYAIMKRATNLLQGYPELIESFNAFLPDGYRIVTLSDDHEMSTE